jgi:phage tail sheath protein FI
MMVNILNCKGYLLMPLLVSPGTAAWIIDDSFYVAQTAPTVPLFFIASRADKKQADGVTPAPGSLEHSIVRTVTSTTQAIATYGVPYFRTDISGNALHGDARNEYGLAALNMTLTTLSKAYVVRADIDLSDNDIVSLTPNAPTLSGTGNGTMTGLVVSQTLGQAETWTITATSATTFAVNGFLSGIQPVATVGVPYNNGIISFTINAGGTAFVTNDAFTVVVTTTTTANPLGANDAAKRVTITTALKAEINSNSDIRSEFYEYNIIICPGYWEVAGELMNLNLAINEEAFVIADTPFTLKPEDTATWALTAARQRGADIAYYYPHGVISNLDGRDIFVPASGVALKTIAYSDNVSDVWFPPAGERRGIVQGVSKMGYLTGTLGTATTVVDAPLSQGQRDVLYQFNANINPIPFLPGRGFVVYGQKTSYNLASSRDRINAERTLIKIKRDLRKAGRAYVFELNDRITRESIKSEFEGYLHDILIRRGLYDALVVADETNNTPARIERNELWVNVYVKTAKAAEFIYIPITVVSTGANLG